MGEKQGTAHVPPGQTKLAKHISTLSNFLQLDTLLSYIANISSCLPNSLEGMFSLSYLRVCRQELDPAVASSANATSRFDISIVVSYRERMVKLIPWGSDSLLPLEVRSGITRQEGPRLAG